MDYILPLSEIDDGDAAKAGMKAAVLGGLAKAGFQVPDGFVVTTDALADALRAAVPGTDITALALPDGLAAEVTTALGQLGDGPVAVRSSGVREDLPGQSFAGMYDSVLNVTGPGDVLDAVRACWASGFSDRIAAYHRDSTGDRDIPGPQAQVAVLVQRMVPASAAGVAFSVNPVTWQPGEVTVSAVSGLGDKLMSGESTADEWSVRSGVPRLVAGDGTAIDAAGILSVAELVTAVAKHAGCPQDMEWAVADGLVQVLQARPVTGMTAPAQIPIEEEVPPGFWAQAPNSDTAWVPMQRSVYLPVFGAMAGNIFQYTTGARVSARMIRGWTYISMLPDEPDEQVRKLEEIGTAVARGEPAAVVERWSTEWKPYFAKEIRRLRETPVRDLADAEFERHFRELVAVFADLHGKYFTLASAGIVLLGELGVTGAEVLGLDPAQTLELLGGLVGDHVQAAAGLGDLARMAAAHPRLSVMLADGTADPDRLEEVDGAFATAFARYVSEYGHRTIGFSLTEPTLAEQRGMLLSLIAGQMDKPYDLTAERAALAERRAAVLAGLAERLGNVTSDQRERFERALEYPGARGLSLRDEKVFYAVSCWALVRYAAQELGRRLHAAGLADDPGDGFYLELDEGLSALRGGADVRAAVRQARGEHSWAVAHPGARIYGQYTPPPGTGDVKLSEAARHAQAISGWSMSLRGGPSAVGGREDGLSGLAASPGRHAGPVRVVAGVTEFHKVRRGDVLVCKETTAQWAVLFGVIGALVTDQGSLLSHPAIIAREYRVPAVVATGNATEALHDGQIVTVDGSAGTVVPVSS
jgi:phosphohistidine swiveling domain-containing protein